MALRPYQQECLEAVRQADIEGDRRLVVALPTGTGKTHIASNLPEYIDLQPWETMAFVVDREELAFQAVDELSECNPDLQVTLEKAEYHGDEDADIVVASVDTLSRSPQRLHKYANTPFRAIFLDECHGAVAPKYLKILRGLRVLKGEDNIDPGRLLIGLTATPRRADGVALERIFDRIVYRRNIREMVDAGWLAEPIAYTVDTGVDLDTVKMYQRDFATGQLSHIMNTPRINNLVVDHYLKYGAGLPAIAFTVDIEHSETLAATFRQRGLEFHAISSRTPTGHRRDLVAAHRRMELLGLVSCEALLQGFDSPPATVGLFVRPTCSPVVFTQAFGRIERPYPAPEAAATHTGYWKKNAIWIDFVGVTSKFRLYTAATMFGLHPKFDLDGRSITKTLEHLEQLQRNSPSLDISAYPSLFDIEAAATEVDLWQPPAIPRVAKHCSQFVWSQAREDLYRLPVPGMTIWIEHNLLGQYEVWRQAQDQDEMRLVFDQPEDAFAYADSMVPDEVVALVRSKARWRKDPPSEPQCIHLWRVDPQVRERFSSGEAFYRHARYLFHQGNLAFSKGAISQRIEMCKWAKKQHHAAHTQHQPALATHS